jgi:hypothetical protein
MPAFVARCRRQPPSGRRTKRTVAKQIEIRTDITMDPELDGFLATMNHFAKVLRKTLNGHLVFATDAPAQILCNPRSAQNLGMHAQFCRTK